MADERKTPPIKPTLQMFTPYKETIGGFVIVAAGVVLLIAIVQFLMWL
jgi:hypothetical protein